MRVRDWVEWDVLQAEMSAGVVEQVPQWAVVPYGLLRLYGLSQKRSLGGHVSGYCQHPMGWLWHAFEIQPGAHSWPAAVISAYSEFIANGIGK